MDFSWSTPPRRDGQIHIPNEIYLAIFECIAPISEPLPQRLIETFSAIALVCRFFCAVAQPRVFERVEFWGGTANIRLQPFRKMTRTWARQIVANNERAKSVALYVRECCFINLNDPKEMQEFLFPSSESTLYCQVMGCMSNIRKIVFFRSFVSKGHWETMATLKQLECLTFIHCSFTDNPPDQELSVRSVELDHSPASFVLRPIATSTLRTLETDALEPVLKLVTTRQLAIENFILNEAIGEMTLLLQVLEQLSGLESLALTFREGFAALPLISGLSLKKLFTRLRSFTMRAPHYDDISEEDAEKLLSVICDGPGTLPSLEELNLLFFAFIGSTPTLHTTIPPTPILPTTILPTTILPTTILPTTILPTTLDIAFGHLKGTLIPAFPNMKCIRTCGKEMRLQNGGWKYYSEGPAFEPVNF